jgi:cell division protein FtsI (penicillin-binding protein 3)
MKPRIVKAIIKDGEVVHEFEPEVLREQALSEQTVKDLKMILFEVVNDKNGTGKKVKTDKFQVAGKTGTARRVKPGFGYNYSPMEYLLSFCGYFPADKPQYTCIVQIIKAGPGSGGGMSGLVFKDIAERVMAKSLRLPLQAATDTLNGHTPAAKHGNLTAASYLLDKLDIETDNDLKSNGEYTWGKIRKEGEKLTYEPRNIKEGIVPDVRGMGAKDAIYLLKKAGLNARLSGYGKVTQQTIPPGQKVSKGSHIHITLTP